MIDQLIRKYIKNHTLQLSESVLISEEDKKWDAPYIPDSKTRISKRTEDAALAAGAIAGLPVISKRSKNGVYSESELDAQVKKVFDKAAKKDFPNNYDPAKTLFVYMLSINKDNKKVWNIWAIDKYFSGINEISQKIKELLKKSTYYAQSELQINKIQAISLMSYDQAKKWFTFLEESKTKLNISTPLKLPKLDAIKTLDDLDDEQTNLASQDVEIRRTEDNKYDVYNMSSGKLLYSDVNTDSFDGEAKMSVSADGESLIFQPIFGTQSILEFETNRAGIFSGEFKDGMPYKGNTTYASATNDQIQEFDGEVNGKVYTSLGQQRFKLSKIKGIATYGNGMIFDGDFKDNQPFNGNVFNKNKQAIGYIRNGEYESGLKYPVSWQTNSGEFKVYKLNNKLYAADAFGNWGVIDKDKFENEYFYDADERAVKNIVAITDPKEIATLNKDILNINSPEQQPNVDIKQEPTPTPKPKPAAKKKYVVMKENQVNLYIFISADKQFKLHQRGVPTNKSDRTTGHLLLGSETASIKGSDATKYKMYKFKYGEDIFYIPTRFVNVVER